MCANELQRYGYGLSLSHDNIRLAVRKWPTTVTCNIYATECSDDTLSLTHSARGSANYDKKNSSGGAKKVVPGFSV